MKNLKMKNPFWITSIIMLFTLFFQFQAHAGLLTYEQEGEIEVEKAITGFIPDGYKYYISHHWDYNSTYVLGFFRSVPELTSELFPEGGGKSYLHCQSSDASKITFYDFETEKDLLTYIYSNDNTIVPENCRIRIDYETYMRLDPSDTSYYSNCDLAFSDTGNLYIKSNPYSQIITETVTDDVPYLVGGITTADLFFGLFIDILAVLSAVVPVIIFGIGLKRGLSFFKTLLGGV